jgi:hypothetical protein
MPNCYLCGNPGTKPLELKATFTGHNAARCPNSKHLCDRCAWVLPLRCWYFNPNKGKWSKLFSRNWSWMFVGDSLISPVIQGEYTEGNDTLAIVSNLPTRADIRGWLLNPPDPPFTIAIAESGQKHIIPWAQTAYSVNRFPVQFELDTVYIDREHFTALLHCYESLMLLGFSKTEIDSGEYRSDRLLRILSEWEPLEQKISLHRGTKTLELISHVALKTNER